MSKLKSKLILDFSSERLNIRPLKRKDYQCWRKAYNSALPAQNNFDSSNLNKSDITYAHFLKNIRSDQEKIRLGITYNFYAFSLESNTLIGGAQFWCIQRGYCQRATLGYWVFNNYWRQGYGIEIAKSMINNGIKVLGLNRIEAEIDTRNRASVRLCKKIGMVSEGVRRKSLFEDGNWRDHTVFSITAEDLGIVNRPPDLTIKSII